MAKSTRKPRRSRRRLAWSLVAVLSCAALALGALYVAYLDAKVRARFEGARWSLPAKVYASPLELYVGLEMGSEPVVRALQRQGYRQSRELTSTGTYSTAGPGIAVHTRPFSFWDGLQPARKLRLHFDAGRIDHMEALDGGQDPVLLRLDPLLIGSIYPTGHGEDRILVKLGEAPPMLPAGLIVVEDRNFLDHYGVSLKAILRAAWANLRAGQVVQGGSTITQQLVKNFYLSNRQTLTRKIKEAIMAVLLDAHYSKEAILEAYINEVYLGQDGGRAIHGFGLASYFYFSKPLQELRPHEIALLIGMVKGPSYYDPRAHPERAVARRNLVLDLFEAAGFLSHEEAERARRQPLGVTGEGDAGTTQYPAFIDLVRRQLQGHYRDQDLTTEGLRIFTTLDPSVQAATERRVAAGVAELEQSRGLDKEPLQAAAVVTSVEGGRVLALVGSRDPGYAGYNRALDIQRPIGSLIKPVIYLTALDRPRRYNVLTPISDAPLSVELPNGDVWRPDNFDHESHGYVPLYLALSKSYNLATARLALELGIPDVIDTLQALGYRGEPIPVPSLALGAVGMAPLEVAQIYNTLAAGGYYTPLLAIRAVTTRDGEPLSRYPLQIQRAFSEQSVYLLNWILQRVTRHGTAASAYYTLPRAIQVAGKTGTTDGLRDSWFAGFSANRVAVVWMGRDDNKPSRFTGSSGALQIWARIMRELQLVSFDPVPPVGVETVPLLLGEAAERAERVPRERLPTPAGIALFGARDCSAAVPVPFVAGYVPDGVEPCRAAAAVPQRPADEAGGNWFLELFQ